MLFFFLCASFALFPEQVLLGAQNGLALCLNAVVPSLLPFMVVSSCVIKSKFSRPLGAVLSKIITPLTGISRAGCVCFVTGLLGGYGAGAVSVMESYRENLVTKEEAESLLPFCNNAGPLFVIGTVGVSFYSGRSVGISLFVIQILTAFICARVFSVTGSGGGSVKQEWEFYKKNKPPIGELVTKSAVESGKAIVTACVFIISFCAVTEVLPFGEYGILSGILEVTRGCSEMSRLGSRMLPLTSAFLAWGGMSVHLQANALCKNMFDMKRYYFGKVVSAVVAYIITVITGGDMNIIIPVTVMFVSLMLVLQTLNHFLFRGQLRQFLCRQQRHS